MFNGNGQFEPLSYPVYPAVPGTLIKAADFNQVIDDIHGGLSSCVTRDGQSPLLANLPMGGFKLTGIAVSGFNVPSAVGDVLAWGAPASVTTFTATGNATFNGTLTLTSTLTTKGNVILGDAGADTLTITGQTGQLPNGITWFGQQIFDHNTQGASSVIIANHGKGSIRFVTGTTTEAAAQKFFNNAGTVRGAIYLKSDDTSIVLDGTGVPFQFGSKPPKSAVAASANDDLMRKQEVDAALTAFADGDPTKTFEVANATTSHHAVALGQFDFQYSGSNYKRTGPDGFIEIGGYSVSTIDGTETFSFAFGGFPNQCFQVLIVQVDASPSSERASLCSNGTITNTTFQIDRDADWNGNVGFFYRAVGR